MNKQQMEEIWNGKLLNAFKINKHSSYHTYTWRLDVYKKEKIDSFELSEAHKNEKVAAREIQDKLQAKLYAKYNYPRDNLSWQFQRIYKE